MTMMMMVFQNDGRSDLSVCDEVSSSELPLVCRQFPELEVIRFQLKRLPRFVGR
jgi:hypothetical protein